MLLSRVTREPVDSRVNNVNLAKAFIVRKIGTLTASRRERKRERQMTGK